MIFFLALSLHSPVASLEDIGQYSELKITGTGFRVIYKLSILVKI